MKTRYISFAAISLIAFAACGGPAPETVQTTEEEEIVEVAGAETVAVDLEASEVRWYGNRIVGNEHAGTVELKSAELLMEGDEYVGGSFVADMTTIKDDEASERLEGHLKSEDFFDVENHPEAKFEITSMEQYGEGAYLVKGNLEILGVVKNIEFDAMEEDGALVTEFYIDRTQWGITYDSGSVLSDLGDKAINDEIKFNIKLVTAS